MGKKKAAKVPRKKYKTEPVFSGRQVCQVLLGMFALFMIVLWFVPEKHPVQPESEQPKPEKRKPTRPPRKPKFEYTEEADMEQLQLKITHSAESDRLLVLVLDNGDPNDPNKGRLWSRWERLAKSMRTKTLFQRYEEDEVPLVVRFNCQEPNGLCQNLLGGQPARPLLFKPGKQPKMFASDLRTDRHFLEFLFDEMQPAVRYIEEKNDVVDFMEAYNVVVFLFGDDVNSTLEMAADNMRELAKFGKNRDPEVAQHFDISNEQLPLMTMYRDFGDNAVYGGDMGNQEMITQWVRVNCLPAFGEYNFQTQKRYLHLNVPIMWIYLDRLDESFVEIEKAVLTEVLPMMAENKILGMLTYIDALTGSEVAKNMGAEEYPMLIILSGQKQYHVPLDEDNAGKMLVDTILEWHQENAVDGGAEQADDGYYYEDYYEDDEYDDDDKPAESLATEGLYDEDEGESPGTESLYDEDEDNSDEFDTTEDKQDLRRRLLGQSA